MLFVAAFSQLPQEKKIQKYNFSKKGFYISINYRNTSCSRLQMCLADCDVVWGKLSQGAGFCSPRQLRDVAQLPGLSGASGRAGVGRSRSLPGDCQAATCSSGLELMAWRWEKGRNGDTSVNRVSLCACAALTAGAKAHGDRPGQATSGDSHSTQCSSLFFTFKIFTFAFLKNKVGGKGTTEQKLFDQPIKVK